MSRFQSQPSATYQAAVAALRELQKVEGTDIVGRAYAEAVSEEKKQRWMQQYRLKSDGVCISHLLGKQCRIGYADSYDHECDLPGDDHVVEAKEGRETVAYISQPYSIEWSKLQEMVRYCQEHNLKLHISADDSWHFPGWTLLVEYSRAEKKIPRYL